MLLCPPVKCIWWRQFCAFIPSQDLLNARAGSSRATPLACAVKDSHINIVHVLLEAGADPSIPIESGHSALHLAAVVGQVDIVKDILTFHSDPDILDARAGPWEGTPLAHAVKKSHADVVHELLEAGADPRIATEEGNSALHLAAIQGRADIVKDILRLRVVEDILNSKGGVSQATPLAYAVNYSHTDVVHLLLEAGADPRVTTNAGDSALHLVGLLGQVDIAKEILRLHSSEDLLNARGGKSQATALAYAVDRSYADVVHVLLEAGADPGVRIGSGESAIDIAARKGEVDILMDILRLLPGDRLVKGIGGGSGSTPLIMATVEGHTAAVRILLQAGVPVDAVDIAGNRALHYAAARGGVEIVQCLLSAGADPSCGDRDGITALHHAAKGGHAEIISHLLRQGEAGLSSEVADAKDQTGRTALLLAVIGGHVEAVRVLLNGGADCNTTDEFGSSSLHWACRNGHVRVTQELLQSNADLDLMAQDCKTPLITAVENFRPECVLLLLKAGANPNNCRGNEPSALHIVCSYVSETMETSDSESGKAATRDSKIERVHEIAAMLLRYGGNPEARLEDGTTPLQIAREAGDQKLENMLNEAILHPSRRPPLDGPATAHGSTVEAWIRNIPD